jgi:hypothetical protein
MGPGTSTNSAQVNQIKQKNKQIKKDRKNGKGFSSETGQIE